MKSQTTTLGKIAEEIEHKSAVSKRMALKKLSTAVVSTKFMRNFTLKKPEAENLVSIKVRPV